MGYHVLKKPKIKNGKKIYKWYYYYTQNRKPARGAATVPMPNPTYGCYRLLDNKRTNTTVKDIAQPMLLTGSNHDSKAFDSATKGLEGIFVTDAGYLLKKEELEKMYASARKPITATRKNMKRIMTKEPFRLLHNRCFVGYAFFL